jgi:hypothetical protein
VTDPTFGPEERDALRVLVRQVLRDALPEGVDPAAQTQHPDVPDVDGAAESIVLRTDADLQRFVGRLLTLFENPKRRADLQTGRLRFTLAASSVAGRPVPVRRVDRGAVTETQVKDAARVGASILLGRGAVLTPLARDRARALGVVVERES